MLSVAQRNSCMIVTLDIKSHEKSKLDMISTGIIILNSINLNQITKERIEWS